MILKESLYSISKKIMQINTKNYTFNFSDEITFFFKYSITACNVSLVLIFTIFFLHVLAHFFFKKYVPVFVLLKVCSLVLLGILLGILLIKFYITLKIESILGDYILTLKLDFFKNNAHLPNVELYTLFSSSFGDGIILLSVFVGIICLELIGAKNVFHTINNVSVFLLFIFFTIIMCSTTNLLIMFISFEFMFLPTVYFAYTLGYTKKIDTASRTLIY
jgi:hypothetical protein